jgi:hypothetical protein
MKSTNCSQKTFLINFRFALRKFEPKTENVLFFLIEVQREIMYFLYQMHSSSEKLI